VANQPHVLWFISWSPCKNGSSKNISVFFLFLMLENWSEPNKTGSVWTGSRFGPSYINQECYFPVQLNFLVKTGPWTPLLRTKGTKKNLDPEITLYLRTRSIRMTWWSHLIFDKSVCDICRCKKRLFITRKTKEKSYLFKSSWLPNLAAIKAIYSSL